MSDIRQINTAIQMYIDEKGYAPDLGNPACRNSSSGEPSCGAVDFKGTRGSLDSFKTWNDLAAQLVPKYIPKLPIDPCGQSCDKLDAPFIDVNGANSKRNMFYSYEYFAPGHDGGGEHSSTDYFLEVSSFESKNSLDPAFIIGASF